MAPAGNSAPPASQALHGAHRLVDSPLVATASLHAKRDRFDHWTVWPYVRIVYPAWVVIYFQAYDQLLGSAEATFLSLVFVFTSHALTFLVGEWNVSAKAWLTTAKATDPLRADIVRVIPPPHSGAGALCPIERRTVSDAATGEDRALVTFTFQQQLFAWDDATRQFRELAYLMGRHAGEYRALAVSGGLGTKAAVPAATAQYGKNEFNIPVPTFLDLFKEHAIAPFFVFQVFCVGLWALDEYWYYSLFTLFMLATFESTVVGQRVRTLQEFRGMTHPPRPIAVRRDGKWASVNSDDLVPGDIVSVPRAARDDHVVPCDCILLDGAVVVNEAMLSGESTPLHKESIALRADHETIDDDVLPDTRNHVVYAGTKVVQATPAGNPTSSVSTTSTDDGELDAAAPAAPLKSLGITTPDGGALAVVVRTGFGTTQGKLVRMMVFSSERVSANNIESFLFIGFLLIFAFMAAGYVWVKGQEHGRPPSKLLLDCILIITSVIPPELPMELSMAVNTSLMALSRLAIFCTEPFRIPFAGKLDILCFDKTGTITGEDLVVEGVAGRGTSASDWMTLHPAKHAAPTTQLVLAAAHSLVKLDDGKVIGDPMERAALDAAGFLLADTDRVVRAPPSAVAGDLDSDDRVPLGLHNAQVQILRKFPFSSALKRMSTVARVPGIITGHPGAGRTLIAAVKGAPETIQGMLTVVPEHYVRTYKTLARNGGRVLALGYRVLDTHLDVANVERGEVERALAFAGFLVFSCPLKPDSAAALAELAESGHRCTMITGDAALTACHVARQVSIVTRACLILDNDALTWRTADEATSVPLELGAVADLVDDYDLCVSGPALDALDARGALADFAAAALPYVYVWARVSPAQKEWILTGLKAQGFHTLMCGDGTNDVGALKQAHVGVALLDASPEDLAKIAQHARYRRLKDMYQKQVELSERFGRPPPPMPTVLRQMEDERAANKKGSGSPSKKPVGNGQVVKKAANGNDDKDKAKALERAHSKIQKDVDRMSEKLLSMTEGMDDEAPTLKFGDASVAAPFTSKIGTLVSITNVIKQGRCTLVTTLQMHKILALNCLISAYAMSVLFLDGMKWGDWQMTIQGLLMAACFFFISRGEPVNRLAQARPLSSFFNAYALLSVVLQFAIHAAALFYVTAEAKAAMHAGDDVLEVDFEGKKEFKPNLLNSGVYLLNTSMQVSTFAINYIGRPFRESIRENTALFRGLLVVGSVSFLAAMEVSDGLNDWLQLVPFPAGFADTLTAVMAADFLGAFAVEKVLHWALAKSAPRKELRITFSAPESL
ncbi:putative cation-transporting ATPase 1 [Blastocladiella emersonii ATCC 22665]|nr:putative cation-transporting ATPase 1 [Blastocladiella emersonii ATCC 22665]